MPLKLQILSVKAAQWEGWCRHKLEQYRAIRKSGVMIKQTFALPKNVFAQIVCTDICDIIRLWGGTVSGFICHARSDLFPGGMTPDGKQIMPVYVYPLIDNDHGSTVLTSDGKSSPTWTVSRDAENYGNLDWIGVDGSIVSWRGPASRSFAMDSLHNYPGLTIVDYVVESTGEEHFTPYQNLVYQGGGILFEFPVTSKVLGATDTYVILGVDYAGRINPDGGMNGFFTEVWRGVTERIGWKSDSRPSLSWFFNPGGNEAVSGDYKLNINVDSKGIATVTFSSLDTGTGTQNKSIITGPNRAWSFSRSGNWQMYKDYAGGVLAGVNLTTTENQSTSLSGDGATQTTSLPIMYTGTPATSLIITGPEGYAGPGYYTATGFPSNAGCVDGDLVWTYPTGCGMGTVSATRSDGVSGSMQVRMPIGTWSLTSTWSSGHEATSGATEISGATKTIIGVVKSSNCTLFMAPCFNAEVGHCVDDCVQLCSDNGFPSWGERPSIPQSLCVETTYTVEGDACRATNSYIDYCVMTSEEIYNWVCP